MPTLRSLLTDIAADIVGNPDTEITGIAYDSRRVCPGDLFACLPGTRVHGHRFIPDVLAAGAAALLVEDAGVVPEGVPAVVAAEAREAVALVAANFHGVPSAALTLIGVTGTNGKTTVTTLVRAMLDGAGHPAGLIGTNAYIIGERIIDAPHTTPQAPDLQALLAEMRDAGLTHAVMEVSSHALAQHRVTGCRFHIAAFTNLTQDHLDYHGTLDAYRAVKIDLFANARYQPAGSPLIGLVNADDPHAPHFAARALGPVRHFGLTGGAYRASDISLRADGSTFTFFHPGGSLPARMQLVGSFNVSNALAALAIVTEAGVDPARAVSLLATIPPVAGRFQRIPGPADAPTVVVDYAHTPDGLDKVLATAHEIAPGRVVTVFGCGGDRDRGKRPQMAAVAARWSRRIFVTNDNPRTEDPQQILDDLLAGFTEEDLRRVTVEADRDAAILWAIREADPGDIVVLAGKGHETYQIFGTLKTHFDDREVAANALAARREESHGGARET